LSINHNTHVVNLQNQVESFGSFESELIQTSSADEDALTQLLIAATSDTELKESSTTGYSVKNRAITDLGEFDPSSVNEGCSHIDPLPMDAGHTLQYIPNSLIDESYNPTSEADSIQNSHENAIDLLAMRVGALRVDQDGVLRFFGATSNLHLLQNNTHLPSYREPRRTANTNSSFILNRAGYSQEVSIELEDHLIKLYLAWEDPATHIINVPLFWEARHKHVSGQRGGYHPSFYSDVLINAMYAHELRCFVITCISCTDSDTRCALGSVFTSRIVPDLPTPLSEFFACRAKTLLEHEMDSPCVATVQALVILSAHEASFTRDSKGWLYSGMAIRLSIDLGLHLNHTRYVRNGVLDEREAEVRRVTWWGVFMLDM
jgi:hypothetical protein